MKRNVSSRRIWQMQCTTTNTNWSPKLNSILLILFPIYFQRSSNSTVRKDILHGSSYSKCNTFQLPGRIQSMKISQICIKRWTTVRFYHWLNGTLYAPKSNYIVINMKNHISVCLWAINVNWSYSWWLYMTKNKWNALIIFIIRFAWITMSCSSSGAHQMDFRNDNPQTALILHEILCPLPVNRICCIRLEHRAHSEHVAATVCRGRSFIYKIFKAPCQATSKASSFHFI